MRKSILVLSLAAVSLFASSAVAPRARALPGWAEETYYFNYGATFPSGSEGFDCWGHHWSEGDQTPSDGELMLVVWTNCETDEVVEHWYRYSEVDCPPYYTPGWYSIGEPEYHHSLWPC